MTLNSCVTYVNLGKALHLCFPIHKTSNNKIYPDYITRFLRDPNEVICVSILEAIKNRQKLNSIFIVMRRRVAQLVFLNAGYIFNPFEFVLFFSEFEDSMAIIQFYLLHKFVSSAIYRLCSYSKRAGKISLFKTLIKQ